MSFFNKQNKKTAELKKDTMQRFLRILFWTLLIFLVVRSILGDVFEPEVKFEMPKIKLEREGPGAVAASFVKEYLTYEASDAAKSNKDYRDRVYRFAADYINLPNLNDAAIGSIVEDVFIFDIEKINEQQYDVLIKADVVYLQKDSKKTKSILYIKVPIREANESFVVEDTPVIIPAPNKVDIRYEKFNQGEELYITDTEKIKEIMGNFLKTYCDGKSTEIAYYMDDGKPVKGFLGRFTFLYFKEFHVFDLKVNNEYKAIATVSFQDSISKKTFFQNYNIDLIKRDGRWYVKKLDVRGGNINEKYENVVQD